MEFLLTPAHINVFARQPAGKTPIKQGNSFSFDGDDPIEFEDADSTLHFFFPKDYAHAVGDSLTGFSSRVSLRRYFYSDRGKDYMLVGVPWNWIDSAPEGDLIIDPTTSVATSEDVWLESTSNNDGNSAGLLIGKAADPYPKKRTIIKFNIAGSGIPSSATVLNAQMKLYYYSAANGGSGSWVDRWVQAHQLLVNWAEAQATRDNRLTGTPWNVAYVGLNDIDAKSGYESTLLFQSGQTGTWKAWNLTALTQKWVNGTATNYGVVLWATNETTNGYDLRFHSSDAPPPNNANPPVLEVTYSTDAATKTVYFLKDHLGSIRATVLDSATAPVIGYDDYDPWGYPLALRTKPIPNAYLQGASKNKFTGKEWDDEFGVNLVWVERRPYDSAIGRWVVHDPGNDYYSPYVYVRNNPIVAIDPNGEETYFVNGAGNDPSKWGYSQKIVTALQNAGISDVKHVPITQGQILDQIYSVTANTSDSRYITTRTRFYDDVIIKQRLESNTATLVDAVNKDIAAGNIGSGEQINLVGYSFGSVVTANAALELASKGTTVNNLVLIGSMVSTNSDLYKALSSNSNIKNIIRIDIPNDRFSNPKGIKDFIKGVIDALEKGDKLPHFIYALPQNDKEREELAKQLYDAGVR
jgi:RHS repeat-associated protein